MPGIALRLPALSLVRDGVPVACGRVGRSPDGPPGLAAADLPRGGGRRARGRDCGAARARSIRADRAILALTATPLAIALYSAGLADQIQSSRAAIVSARAEERVRLHRDLHDGLGPVLSGAAFRADAVHNVLRTDPDRAQELLARGQGRDPAGAGRRPADRLRPCGRSTWRNSGWSRRCGSGWGHGPARVTARRWRSSWTRRTIFPDCSRRRWRWPPYRIAVEAVTNVARHSDGRILPGADSAPGECLTVEVTDDGRGRSPGNLAPWTPGVGIRSMIDRAEELGGTGERGPHPGGRPGVRRNFPLR